MEGEQEVIIHCFSKMKELWDTQCKYLEQNELHEAKINYLFIPHN